MGDNVRTVDTSTKAKPDGAIRVAQNGYEYTKVNGKWRLSHHIIAEETLGRPIRPEERVIFVDGDRTNFQPKNIKVVLKGKSNKAKTLAQLRARRDELDARIKELEEELESESLS